MVIDPNNSCLVIYFEFKMLRKCCELFIANWSNVEPDLLWIVMGTGGQSVAIITNITDNYGESVKHMDNKIAIIALIVWTNDYNLWPITEVSITANAVLDLTSIVKSITCFTTLLIDLSLGFIKADSKSMKPMFKPAFKIP